MDKICTSPAQAAAQADRQRRYTQGLSQSLGWRVPADGYPRRMLLQYGSVVLGDHVESFTVKRKEEK